jgi:hypothetical protein
MTNQKEILTRLDITALQNNFTGNPVRQLLRAASRLIFLLLISVIFFSSAVSGQPGKLDRTFQASLEQLGGDVYTLVTQPDGKILVGGYFKFIGNGTRINIARLNSDGTLDPRLIPAKARTRR